MEESHGVERKKRGRRKKKQHFDDDDGGVKLKIGSIQERIAEGDNPRKLCTVCKKEFPTGNALGGHMRAHAQDSSSHRFINGEGGGFFICPNHSPETTAPVCHVCGKAFLSWKSLYGHMRCHSGRQWREGGGEREIGSLRKKSVDLLRAIPPWPVTGKRGRGVGASPPAEEVEILEAARNLLWLAGGPRLWAGGGGGYFCKRRRNCTDGKGRFCPDGDITRNCCLVGPKNGDGLEKKKRGRKKKVVVKVEITEDFIKDSGRVTRPVYPDVMIPGPSGFQCITCKEEFSTYQALGGHRSKHQKESSFCNPGPETGSTGTDCCGELLGSGLVPTLYQWGGPTTIKTEMAAPVDGWAGQAGRFRLVVDATNQPA